MDLDPIVSTALLIAVLAGELWFILRTTRPGGVEIEDIWESRFDPPWPRGVQEEDLAPWHVDSLTPTYGRSPDPSGTASDRQPSGTRTTAGRRVTSGSVPGRT